MLRNQLRNSSLYLDPAILYRSGAINAVKLFSSTLLSPFNSTYHSLWRHGPFNNVTEHDNRRRDHKLLNKSTSALDRSQNGR